jgi:hypothetical protein
MFAYNFAEEPRHHQYDLPVFRRFAVEELRHLYLRGARSARTFGLFQELHTHIKQTLGGESAVHWNLG